MTQDLNFEERVALVTGGGNGLGAAVVADLARLGAHVFVLDPGTTVAGEREVDNSSSVTVEALVEAGYSVRLLETDVGDRDAVRDAFADIIRREGRIDIVVHAAGIHRLSELPQTTEIDWVAPLTTHVAGFLNVLAEATPIMAAQRHGRIIGFTSGVGLSRTIEMGPSYACAKRAIAALAWTLGGSAPTGVTINALSPIAATRMVRAMLTAGGRNTDGLDLSAMTQPDDVAPTVSFLASDQMGWCSGQVIFSVGTELSINRPAALVEMIQTSGTEDLLSHLEVLTGGVLDPSAEAQATTGGYHPRVRPARATRPSPERRHRPSTVLLGLQDEADEYAWTSSLSRLGLNVRVVAVPRAANGLFERVEIEVRNAAEGSGRLETVIVVGRYDRTAAGTTDTDLERYCDLIPHTVWHAAWSQAVMRHASAANDNVRLLHITAGTGPAADAAGQMVTQLSRCANATPGVRSKSFSVTASGPASEVADVSAALAVIPGDRLAGQELVLGPTWLGLRAHPGPASTVTLNGGPMPPWIGEWLAEVAVCHRPSSPEVLHA